MEHRELYQYVEYIVKRYYKFYRKIYLNASIDYEDLIQEAHLTTAMLLEKIKNKKISNRDGKTLDINNSKEVKTLVSNAVGRRLDTIRKWRAIKDSGVSSGEKTCQCSSEDRNEIDGFCLNCGRRLGRIMEINNIVNEDTMEKESANNLSFEEVHMRISIDDMANIALKHPKVKANDFRMFCEKFLDDKTLQEIGNKYRVSRQRVKQKIDRVRNVLQQYFEK